MNAEMLAKILAMAKSGASTEDITKVALEAKAEEAKAEAKAAEETPTPAEVNPNARFGSIEKAATASILTPPAMSKARMIAMGARALCVTKGNLDAAFEFISAPVSKGGLGAEHVAQELSTGHAAMARAYQVQDPASAGLFVQDTWSDNIIELLQPGAILAKTNPMEIPNPTGTHHTARELTEPVAYWAGPEAPADSGVKASKGTFGGLTFTEKNLWAFLIFSNKLLRIARPAIDKMGERQLRRVFTKATDTASHFGTGAFQPFGLFTNPVKNACGSVITGALPDKNTPIKFLIEYMKNDGPLDGGLHWTMHPTLLGLFMQMRTEDGYLIYPETRDLENPRLFGIPVVLSTLIPVSGASHNPTYLTLGNWDYFAVAPVRGLEVAYSNQASVPAENGTMRSLWANDESAVRMQWAGDMGPTQPKAFVLSNGADIWTTA